MTKANITWIIIGLAGQGCFTARFFVQWLQSERQRKSVIPIEFWYFSLIGGLVLLTYAIYKRDIVFILGQLFGVIVYTRNLYFIHQRPNKSVQMNEYPSHK